MATTFDNQFLFIIENERIMYKTAYDAITQLELWHYMKNFDEESFMFSNSPKVMCIYNKIEELGYNGHSGASFGCIMRSMQYIAKYGLDNFSQEYTKKQS
jgi:hypothetical protein